MCKTSVAVVILFIICSLQVIDADYTDARYVARVIRTPAMRWINRNKPHKFRKLAIEPLLTMDSSNQERLRNQVQQRFGDLVKLH